MLAGLRMADIIKIVIRFKSIGKLSIYGSQWLWLQTIGFRNREVQSCYSLCIVVIHTTVSYGLRCTKVYRISKYSSQFSHSCRPDQCLQLENVRLENPCSRVSSGQKFERHQHHTRYTCLRRDQAIYFLRSDLDNFKKQKPS